MDVLGEQVEARDAVVVAQLHCDVFRRGKGCLSVLHVQRKKKGFTHEWLVRFGF